MGNSLLSSPITDIETERGVLHSASCKQKRASSSLNNKTSCPTDTSRTKTKTTIPQCSNLMQLCSSQEIEECTSFAISSCQGWRPSMEDEHICEPELKCMDHDTSDSGMQKVLHQHSLFCIFDGHGGKFASSFCKQHFLQIFYNTFEYRQYCKLYTSKQKQNSNTQRLKRKKKNQKLQEEHYNYKSVQDPDSQLCNLLQAAISKTCLEMDVQMLTEMKNMQRDGLDTRHIEQWNVTQDGYEFFDTGTTALILLLTPNYIICGNLGDCRAILIKKGLMSSTSSSSSASTIRNPVTDMGKKGSTANNTVFADDVIPLSFDHKPSNEGETTRIIAAGGSVTAGKIDGVLAVSRGLGDFTFKDESTILPKKQKIAAMKSSKPPLKQMKEKKKGGFCGKKNDAVAVENQEITPIPVQNKVSSTPDFIVIDRDEENELFLVAGCDGIFDVVSNEECGELVSTLFQEGERDVGYLVEETIEVCLRKGSMDNMSMLLIKFPNQKTGNGGGVMKRRKARLVKQQMGESQRQPMGEI